MRVLARSGLRGAALAQYEACRKALAEELGIEVARDLLQQGAAGILAEVYEQ